MVDVEISSDQSLQLPSGNFLYKLRSELTNCTVSISVTEGKYEVGVGIFALVPRSQKELLAFDLRSVVFSMWF